MASCYSIVVSALQKLGIVGNIKAPLTNDLNTGLAQLQSLYLALFQEGAFGRPEPALPTTPTYICRENEHVIRRGDTVQEILLPDLIESAWPNQAYGFFYDSRLCDRPRPPHNGAFVIITDQTAGTTAMYFYEALIAKWISVLDLTLQVQTNVTDANGNVISVTPESTAPLSTNSNGLACYLACQMADQYGMQLNPVTLQSAKTWLSSITTRFGDNDEIIHMEYF